MNSQTLRRIEDSVVLELPGLQSHPDTAVQGTRKLEFGGVLHCCYPASKTVLERSSVPAKGYRCPAVTLVAKEAADACENPDPQLVVLDRRRHVPAEYTSTMIDARPPLSSMPVFGW